MLVLSRKPNESIIIGEPPNQIVVKILEIRGDRVRIGIAAPQNVPVDRAEVRDRSDYSARKTNQDGSNDGNR